MNIEETKKAIEVMQAFVDGKDIQYRPIDASDWRVYRHTNPPARICHVTWSWSDYDYRVKPEPLECWVTVYNDHLPSTVHTSKEGALKVATTVPGPAPPSVDKGWTVRKFREVIE